MNGIFFYIAILLLVMCTPLKHAGFRALFCFSHARWLINLVAVFCFAVESRDKTAPIALVQLLHGLVVVCRTRPRACPESVAGAA